MARLLKISVGILAAIGLAIVLLVIRSLFPSSADHTCSTYPVMSVSSPSGKMIAVQEQIVCGNGSKIETYVWVLERDNPNTKWSVFTANSAQQIGETKSFQPLSLAVQWAHDSHLVITYPTGTNVTSVEESKQGIRVSYVERPSGTNR